MSSNSQGETRPQRIQFHPSVASSVLAFTPGKETRPQRIQV
eukprot:gene26554-18322_t